MLHDLLFQWIAIKLFDFNFSAFILLSNLRWFLQERCYTYKIQFIDEFYKHKEKYQHLALTCYNIHNKLTHVHILHQSTDNWCKPVPDDFSELNVRHRLKLFQADYIKNPVLVALITANLGPFFYKQ